jgi:phosphoglycolate phosphatase
VPAVVFDLDGTLIDSAPDIHRVAVQVLAEEGLGPLAPELVRGFIGNGLPALVARLCAAHGLLPDPAREARMAARFEDLYLDAHGLTRPYPGAPEALAALERAGHVLGLCTNKPEAPARAALAAFGLAGHFRAVTGGDTLPARKPDPAPLRHTFAALGRDGGLFVGDSEVDAETAAAAGCPFLLFTGGYRRTPAAVIPAAARFDRFDELPGLVARLAGGGA